MRERVILIVLLVFTAVGTAGAFPVPDTGIKQCYDAAGNLIFPCPAPGESYYGQDGNIIHNDMSYTDNGNGTLTDNVTGLLWQKTADTNIRNWDDAASFCSSLDLGGHNTGWRLPDLVELDSIMDLSIEAGASINPAFNGTTAAGYWTAVEDADDSTRAWILDFGTNEDFTAAKTDTFYTRCVRTEVAQ